MAPVSEYVLHAWCYSCVLQECVVDWMLVCDIYCDSSWL